MYNEILKKYYWLRNINYHQCIVRANGQKIGEIIQAEPCDIQGAEFALISTALKRAWYKPIWPLNLTESEKEIIGNAKPVLFTDGLATVCIADITDSIPLYEDVKIFTETICNDVIVKTTTKTILKSDKKDKPSKPKSKEGIPIELKSIGILPTMLYEITNGHFVTMAISLPKSKYAELVLPLIIGILAVAFLVWYFITTKQVTSL